MKENFYILGIVLVIVSIIVVILVLVGASQYTQTTFTVKTIKTSIVSCGFASCTNHFVITTKNNVLGFNDESWALIEDGQSYNCQVTVDNYSNGIRYLKDCVPAS